MKQVDPTTPGGRLRALRKNAQMTQCQLAEKIGERQSVVSDMERNEYDKPSASLIAKLAQALSTTPDYILEGTGPALRTTRLDPAEHELLNIYRNLETRDRSRLLQNARTYLDTESAPAPADTPPRRQTTE